MGVDRTKRLLEAGYFPVQLPPPFRTTDLAQKHATLYPTWLALQEKPKRGALIPRAPRSRPELFSVARAGRQRRVTSLPNPVSQTFLATHVAASWGALIKHFRQSKLSTSRPRFIRLGVRAANIPSMRLLYERKILKAAGYRFMLRTDISRFFPTIYTHSIAWALHGKTAAKRYTSPSGRYFGNLLDLSLRQGQDQQTMGLPIGPDTSHVIAEAIVTSVDLELSKRLKKAPPGFRYVDDYYLFFSTLNEAETALAALMRALKEFELHINFDKTKICPVADIGDDYWTHELSSFEISSRGQKQVSDIHYFFELAKRLAQQNATESVMTYALKRASSTLIRKDAWDRFEAHLCHIALAYPITLQTVAKILSTYCDVGYPINKSRLDRMLNAVILEHAPLGHHSEVAWCLWMCRDLGLRLGEDSIDLVSEMHSSVCALLLLDLHAQGALPRAPKISYWKQFEETSALCGDMWLLAYEAGMRGWAGFTDAHIRADRYFDAMRSLDIHFYADDAELAPLFHPKPDILESLNLMKVADLFDLKDADQLIEFEDTDAGYEGPLSSDAFRDLVGSAQDRTEEADEEDKPYS